MALDWSPLVSFLHSQDNILLMTHMRPDADGMGSQLALGTTLRSLGKNVRVAISSPLPPRYDFLNTPELPIERFVPPGKDFQNVGGVVVMDTGTWNQLGDFGPFLRSLSVPKFVVDHHLTQDDLGATRLVDVSAEATGRLTAEIIEAMQVPMSAKAAHYSFMALASDTGWFRHQNTTAASFALAEKLVRAGANPTPLYEQLFECAPLARLKLTALALNRLQTEFDGQVAYLEVLLSDYDDTGAVPGDTEDLINYPRSVDGIEIALMFIEQPEGGTKVSFRSRSRVDVSKIAEQFQGGGHKRASGARTVDDLPTTKRNVLKAIEFALTQTS